ncbi:MAG: NAD-dependent epimerase/dehydratase family protein [archaeon]|nr:NAD-dependent epimerase/dehydratase family protein [archaeon]
MIAITGSNGAIGRALCARLAKKGFEIRALDRKTGDVLDKKALTKAFAGCEIVIHCAAVLDEDSKKVFEVNVLGTENAVKAAAAAGAEQFILFSSVGVYGSLPGKKSESTKPNPQTPYEKSKLAAEEKALEFQELINVTILRPALVVAKNTYWEQIIKTVKKNFPLPGGGKNAWQMVCLEDLAEAAIFCVGNEKCYGETFIVAEKNTRTLMQTVMQIRKAAGIGGKQPTMPLWAAKILAQLNSLARIVPLFTPAYLNRMARERNYDTTKLERIGWSAKKDSLECLAKITQEFGKPK